MHTFAKLVDNSLPLIPIETFIAITFCIQIKFHSSVFHVFRCMKMSLVHDLAECIVGDITPTCGISKEEKNKREKVSEK